MTWLGWAGVLIAITAIVGPQHSLRTIRPVCSRASTHSLGWRTFSFRLDLGDRHELTWLAKIPVRREADLRPNLQSLPLRDNAVGAANIRPEQILNPFVCVEAAATRPHLNQPAAASGTRSAAVDHMPARIHRRVRDWLIGIA